jgi:sugar phosphate isomerase/epimerase
MSMKGISRRGFVAASLVAAGAARRTMASNADSSRTAQGTIAQIRLGGPVFVRTEDPDEVASAHVKLGYRAAYCPNVPLDDETRISAFRDAFKKRDVVIAEVGRWVNLLEADPEKRRLNLKQVTEGLALAEAIGALCCVDIAGSYNRTRWDGPHPDNVSDRFFDAAVENARSIIDAVKPKRAKLSYEMMGWAIPDSPDSALKLLKAVDRPAFAVHLDPCNLINSPARFYRSTDLLNECFDKLGPWIVSCHAKDLTWDAEMNVHFREVRPGAGTLDYRVYLERLSKLPQAPTLMIEHLPNAEEYDKARQHIFQVGKAIGISFG